MRYRVQPQTTLPHPPKNQNPEPISTLPSHPPPTVPEERARSNSPYSGYFLNGKYPSGIGKRCHSLSPSSPNASSHAGANSLGIFHPFSGQRRRMRTRCLFGSSISPSTSPTALVVEAENADRRCIIARLFTKCKSPALVVICNSVARATAWRALRAES